MEITCIYISLHNTYDYFSRRYYERIGREVYWERQIHFPLSTFPVLPFFLFMIYVETPTCASSAFTHLFFFLASFSLFARRISAELCIATGAIPASLVSQGRRAWSGVIILVWDSYIDIQRGVGRRDIDGTEVPLQNPFLDIGGAYFVIDGGILDGKLVSEWYDGRMKIEWRKGGLRTYENKSLHFSDRTYV